MSYRTFQPAIAILLVGLATGCLDPKDRRPGLRLSGEVVTEAIDIAGLAASETRDVRLVLGGGTVWAEDNTPLRVEVRSEADPVPEPVLDLREPEAEVDG